MYEYMYRERERLTYMQTYVGICVYIYIYNIYISGTHLPDRLLHLRAGGLGDVVLRSRMEDSVVISKLTNYNYL